MKNKKTIVILLFLVLGGIGTYYLLQRPPPNGKASSGSPPAHSQPSSMGKGGRTPNGETAEGKTPAIPASTKVEIHEIVAMNAAASFQERLRAVHALSKNLTENEVRLLQDFLKEKKIPDGMNSSQIHALKNDIVNVLHEQATIPPQLAQTLLEIYQNPTQDEVMRDYAIQHLMVWYRDIESSDQSEIQKALWQALNETDSSIGGTALLALTRLSSEFPEFDREKVRKSAVAMVQQAKVGELAKITALQICAQEGQTEILPEARKIALSHSSIPLRISAIAALGMLGNESDRSLLEKFAQDDKNPHFQIAAQSALKRLGSKK